MIRNLLLTVVVVLLAWIAGRDILQSSKVTRGSDAGPESNMTAGLDEGGNRQRHANVTVEQHGGHVLSEGNFALEVVIREGGMPPEMRIYPYREGVPVSPSNVQVQVMLDRLGGTRDVIDFIARDDYLVGDRTISEPHSFDVTVTADMDSVAHVWTYQSLEGRTTITQPRAFAAGVETEIAGPQVLTETRTVTGYVQVPPNRVVQVRARYPGLVERIHAKLGQRVRKGDALITVQSNDSLRSYTISAPISGEVVAQNIRAGETVNDEVIVVVVDTSGLWAELDVFPQDFARVRIGQKAHLETLSGETRTAPIEWISPLAAHPSQSIRARVTLNNEDGDLRPGQFVKARVVIAEHEVPIAVRLSAVQNFRDWDVVFARFGETYEVRMIESGRADENWLEVVGGLAVGTEYVTTNSYLIKADLDKWSASHDH